MVHFGPACGGLFADVPLCTAPGSVFVVLHGSGPPILRPLANVGTDYLSPGRLASFLHLPSWKCGLIYLYYPSTPSVRCLRGPPPFWQPGSRPHGKFASLCAVFVGAWKSALVKFPWSPSLAQRKSAPLRISISRFPAVLKFPGRGVVISGVTNRLRSLGTQSSVLNYSGTGGAISWPRANRAA